MSDEHVFDVTAELSVSSDSLAVANGCWQVLLKRKGCSDCWGQIMHPHLALQCHLLCFRLVWT